MKDNFFWEALVSLLDSSTWKFIATYRVLAQTHIRRRIGNWQTSSLWFDPWLEEGRIAELLGRDISVAREFQGVVYHSQWPMASLIARFITIVAVYSGNRYSCTSY